MQEKRAGRSWHEWARTIAAGIGAAAQVARMAIEWIR
jgi:hypothetical protein